MIVPEQDRITIDEVVTARGLDVEEIREDTRGASWQVVVVVDGDGGVSLDTLAAISTELDPLAEHWGSPDTPVTLEVSSRGVDAPLTKASHWRRAYGRVVELSYREGSSGPERARVGEFYAADNSVRLVWRQGKKLIAQPVALEALDNAVVRVEFSSAPAAELELLDKPQRSDNDSHDGIR